MSMKIILDSDPGIDDAAAISVAINNDIFDLKLISTVAGNVTVDKTTKNAMKIARFFNTDVEVASGAEQPLLKPFEDAARVHGESGMDGYDFKYKINDIPSNNAVERLYDTIISSKDKITLVLTGAYTNIALLLKEHPDVKNNIKQVVVMGGSIGQGNMTGTSEFNVFTDPHAASILYSSGLCISMIGLNVTMKALVTYKSLQTIKELGKPGEMLGDLFDNYYQGHEGGIPMHDVNTLTYLINPEIYTMKQYWIDVVTEGPAIGSTVADIRGAYHNGKTNANVATDINVEAFNEWFINEISNMKVPEN